MDDPAGPDEAEIERLRAEQLRLEAEVDELRARLGTDGRRRGGRTRWVTATALVVVASLVFTVAVAGVWARRNALNTEPLGGDGGPDRRRRRGPAGARSVGDGRASWG